MQTNPSHFPLPPFFIQYLRPRNNGQLPEMDMRTGHPFSSLKFGFRSGGFLPRNFRQSHFSVKGAVKQEQQEKSLTIRGR